MNRKTHQRLIDQPQLRHLCWSEEYLLSGRFYECTLPKRNALLLQVVAGGVGDGWCKRCVSDIAPFKECARDTTEDSPWLNGACANCGTAEANSTCCHHLCGTAHLERGRSNRPSSERLREFINPTRSIELLSRLEYEKDDDSDTYSADSYAESDNSSVYEHEGLDDDHTATHDDSDDGGNGETTINNFWTPKARSEDVPSAARQHSAIGSGDGSGGLFLSPAVRSPNLTGALGNVHLPDNSTSRGATALPTPDIAQARRLAASSGTCSLQDAGRTEMPRGLSDRSSLTMAAESPASQPAYDHTTGHSVHHGLTNIAQFTDHDKVHGNEEPFFVQDSASEAASVRTVASSRSSNTTSSRAAAIQSVETFRRTFATNSSDTNATSSEEPHAASTVTRSRKRAASQPSEFEPATFRPTTDSSHSSRKASNHNDTGVDDHRAQVTVVKAKAESSTRTKIDRGSTHEGCRANWPCMHPDNATPHSETMVTVYRDAIHASYQSSVGEVQYILSRYTCHWASAFTKVWDGWCEIESTPVNVELAKPQFLLSDWTEVLLEAAKECCPTDPKNRVCITID